MAKSKKENVEKFNISKKILVKKPLMSGEEVDKVCDALIEKGYLQKVYCEKGCYNLNVAMALRKFQADNALVVTGVVDKYTTIALGGEWVGETK